MARGRAQKKQKPVGTSEKNQKELIIKRQAGCSIIKHRPVFANDSSSIFIIWNNSIRQYSTKTGQLVRTLQNPTNHTITSLGRNHAAPSLLYGCTNTGQLISWNEESGLLNEINTLNVFHSETVKVVDFYITKYKKLCLVFQDDNDSCYKFKQQYLVDDKENPTKGKKFKIACQLGDHSYSFGGADNSEFLACIYKNKLTVQELNEKQEFMHFTGTQRMFRCVKSHAKESCIATGDVTGRVLIWRDFLGPKAIFSIYHWHTLPCNDIVFTPAASHFYSGGSECTLVKWMMDSSSDSKTVLPRMGAPIRHLTVSSNNEFLAVSTEENAILIVDARVKVVQTIQHLSLAPANLPKLQLGLRSTDLNIEPISKALVFNGAPGFLQFFSVETQDLMFKLDVVRQNLLTQERNTAIINTDVTCATISDDGHWLATVEEREDDETHREIRLKFWRSHWLDTFRLHTSIELPHQDAVFTVRFQPGLSDEEMPRAATTGADHKLKLWTLLDISLNKAEDENHGSWACDGVGTHQGLQAGPAAFAGDGSLLAVGFEHALTLWHPDTCQLESSLTHPQARQSIKHIAFGNAGCCHLLVSATDKQLSVWNLLTVTLSWTVPLSITCLVRNPCNDIMAAFTADQQLFVFKPSEAEPLFNQNLSEPSRVVSAVFSPYKSCNLQKVFWQQEAQLFFLTEKQELLSLAQESEDNVEDDVSALPLGDLAPHYETAFSALLAQQSISNVKKSQAPPIWEQQLKANQSSYAHMLCNTAAHMLPPMELIVRDLVKEYLHIQCSSVTGEDEEVPMQQSNEQKPQLAPKQLVKDKKKKSKANELGKVLQENMEWVEFYC